MHNKEDLPVARAERSMKGCRKREADEVTEIFGNTQNGNCSEADVVFAIVTQHCDHSGAVYLIF